MKDYMYRGLRVCGISDEANLSDIIKRLDSIMESKGEVTMYDVYREADLLDELNELKKSSASRYIGYYEKPKDYGWTKEGFGQLYSYERIRRFEKWR